MDQIFAAIRSLLISERVRLIEQIVHDFTEASADKEGQKPLLGLFEDEPELIDEICAQAMRDRGIRSWPIMDSIPFIRAVKPRQRAKPGNRRVN